jgi:ribonuclease-3
LNNFLLRIRSFFSADKEFIFSLRNLLGFTPNNISLYKLAFSHKASAEEHASGIKLSNERLEYLGDAILGAVVADLLFKKFPFKEEGFLTEMRSRIVNREHLNKLAMKIGVDHFMANSNSVKTRSVYGNAFEALIGAIYMDKGYRVTQRFIINRIIQHHVDVEELENLDANFKSKLINWAQRERKAVTFELIEEIDNGGKRLLKVCVKVDGEEHGQGEDFSKKRAEQIAAEKACIKLGLI